MLPLLWHCGSLDNPLHSHAIEWQHGGSMDTMAPTTTTPCDSSRSLIDCHYCREQFTRSTHGFQSQQTYFGSPIWCLVLQSGVYSFARDSLRCGGLPSPIILLESAAAAHDTSGRAMCQGHVDHGGTRFESVCGQDGLL